MALHGYAYRFTLRDGRVMSGDARWFTTKEAAADELRRQLKAWNWTPPKWWEYWRWRDYPREWP